MRKEKASLKDLVLFILFLAKSLNYSPDFSKEIKDRGKKICFYCTAGDIDMKTIRLKLEVSLE